MSHAVSPGSVAAALALRAARTPGRTAYIFLADGEEEQGRLTYAALDARARAIAAGLSRTFRPGDRALLLYPPGLDFIAAFFGCLYAGVIAVPAYPPRSPRMMPRLLAILADAQPAVALASAASLQRVRGWLERTPEAAALSWLATDDLVSPPARWEPPAVEGAAGAFLQYTSGSTSTPKGVIVTQANLAHNQRVIEEACGHSEESVFVSWLPPYHDLGLIGNILQATWVGAPCVLMAPVAFLQSPVRWLRAVSRYRATTSGGPNFAYDLCVRRVPPAEIAKLDLSSWQVAFNGAEPVREETLARFAAACTPAGFRSGSLYPCYGLAEATLMVSGGRPGEEPVAQEIGDRRLVGCGRVLPGVEAEIVDPETGAPVPPGAVGEIWVAGGSVARGYWNRPEETEQVFGARTADGGGPWLRTGDLGALDGAGGELYVAGRLKDLIILRGRNHYPQDLEATAGKAHPALGDGTGAAFAIDLDGEERLVIVHEADRHSRRLDEIAAAVRQAIAEEHEALVYDVVLVPEGVVPRTTSGKVQRRACRDLYLRGELRVLGTSRLSPAAAEEDPGTEALPGSLDWLRRAFAAAARVDPVQVDPDRPLSASGLDSLAAVELKQAVEEATGVDLPLADLLEGMTLREVERRVALCPAGTAIHSPGFQPGVDAAGAEHPLSWNQRSLWFLHRLAPESPAYNIAGAARLHGADAAALGRALQVLVDRHPMLRATFSETPDGPVQRVAERAEVAFEVVEADGWSDAEVLARLHAEAFRPFDLAAGPLLRAVLVRREGEAFFALAVHHIAADFWSMTVLARELGALAAGETPPPPAASYVDFALRQQEMLGSPAGERLWEHWRERVSGTPQLDLPTDLPRQPVQTLRGGWRTLPPSPERAEAVHRLAASHGCTPFVALLAAWQAVLSRWSGQEEFLTGSPMAGRSARAWGDVIGYFVNLVPLRARLSGDPAVRELMARTRGTVLDALAHQDLPFALLTERLQPERDPSRPPLVPALLAFEKAPDPELAPLAAFAVGVPGARLDLSGLVLESLPLVPPAAQVDLSLMAAELPAGLAVSLQWDADLFDETTVGRMLDHLDRLLAGMAAESPELPLSALTGLSDGERHQLVTEWGADPGLAPGEPDLCERIETFAQAAPDHLAVAAADGRLTYGELQARAQSLARHLRRLGVGPEERVAVGLERSPDLVVALLAVLESGGAYVPLDPAYPAERLAFLLEDSRAPVLVTRSRYRRHWDRFPESRIVLVDEPAENGAPEALPEPASPEHLAYVVYTSGSTGRPKGVCIERAALSGLVSWHRAAYGTGPRDRAALVASPAFDASAWEVWSCLASGASLHIPPEELIASPPDLLAWLQREEITVCFLPTPLAEAVLAEVLPEGLALRVLLTGGDRLRRAPEVDLPFSFVNHYGPTESTVVATCGLVEAGQRGPVRPVPIGRPIAGVSLFLLDPSGQPAPLGAPGEICLGGRRLARGYLGAAALTAEKLVPSPWGPEPGARLYRTGDLARYRPDGALEFLGRIDHQVKVRGVRIELGEIEAALSGLPGVREAAVVARQDRAGDPRLVAYVAGDADAGELRRALHERLPAAMIPAAFVALPGLPRTANGKVDRKALPAPQWQPAGEDLEPRTPVEEVVAGVWAELLGLERVGLHESFFDLGGHSLLATRAVARLHAVLGVDLPLRVLFERPTVAELAVRIDEARRGAGEAAPPLVPAPRGAGLPLSFAQERLWFLDRLAPGQPVYNIPIALRLRGPLAVPRLEAALATVVGRHEALRTTFPEVAGRPVQRILPAPPFFLPLVDLASLPGRSDPSDRSDPSHPSDLPARQALTVATAEARLPFDLAAGPLCRALLLRLDEEEHLLVIGVHHIVFDGWSTGVLLRELEILYIHGEGAPLPPLPVQYADFAVWQRAWLDGGALAAQLDAWRERLAGAPPALDLPVDRRRPGVQTFRGGAVPVTLPEEPVRGLRAAARGRGATLFMAVLAGWAALLHRSSGAPEVVVGSPVANRRQPELAGLIGLFVNTLPLRVDLGGDPPFAELLDRVRTAALAAYEDQDVPFERLVEAVGSGRDLSRSPLFQVMLALQDEAPARFRLPGVTAEEVPLHLIQNGTAKLELVLSLTGADGALSGSLEFNADLFDAATAQRLADRLARLLAGAAAEPELRVGDIPLLGEGEERQLLGDWRGSAAPYPREALVHELFAAWAAAAGDRVAVEAGDARLTYAGLEAQAHRLARHLRRLGVGPDDRVGLAVPRSPEMVVALLGILAAGGAYLPLDPSWPAERLALLAEEARPAALVTLEPLLDRLPGGIPAVCLDRDRKALAAERPAALEGRATADHLAYVLFTSGSTGRPRGVAVPHRGVVRLVRGGGFARLDAGQTLLQLAPLSFDASTLEIWGALCNGGRLVLAPPEPPSLAELGALLTRHGVTTLWLTAGLFHQMVDEEIDSLRGLSQLLAGGDVLSPLHVQRAIAALPGRSLINGYGPTENTTFTSCHLAADAPEEARVPIGRPIANTTAVVLDRAGRPAPVGIPGELYAGGDGLARGYLGRPDQTAERFVPSPFAGAEDAAGARLYRTGDLVRRRPDGALDFLGRIDRQVKVRGFRIEPGEIEAALRALPGVREAAVVARDQRLIAYVTGDATAGLREHLRLRLPEHMIPSFFVALPDLPLTPNGKVDRRALPDPETELAPAGLDEPRTPLEELLAGLWAEVLGRERVGIHESFFDLGGHSLLATRLIARLRAALGVELPVGALFERPTVAALAVAVEEMSRTPAPPLVPREDRTDSPLSPAQERLWFLDRLEPGNPVYNVPLVLRLRGPVSAPALAAALGAVAGRHEVLRSRFVESAGRPVQAISTEPRFPLSVVDLAGLPGRSDPSDRSDPSHPSDLPARQALDQAGEEARRPFDLAAGPLCRAVLLRLGEEDHLLAIDIHHIAFDGWSVEILLRELELHASGQPLPPLPLQYADFAVWQRASLARGAFAGQVARWRERLAGAPAALDLPIDRPRPPVQTFRGGAEPLALPAELVRALRALGRSHGATLFMTVLAGWAALLHRMSGSPEVVVGSPVANRRQPELEGLIGLFVNTLPLRVDLGGDPPFAELLDRVRTTALAAYEDQDVPFERLVEEVETGRDLSRSPLFQVMLALRDGAAPALRLPGVASEEVPIHNGTAKFELLLALNGIDGGLGGGLEFNSDLFDRATAQRLVDGLARLLAGAVAGPELRIGDLPLLGETEERQLLVGWNATAAPFPADLGLHELFEAQAARTPQGTALIHGTRRVSYGELDAWADRLAQRLRTLDVGPESLVGVFCGRTPDLIAAVLAVLKAGGAYLPLDPAYPAERLRFLLADSGASVVLTEAGVADALPAFAGTVVPTDPEAGSPAETARPRGFVDPGQAAYAIYTSGSTGVPKGVLIRHGSAVARITWALSAYPRDVLAGVLAATSICFDLSVFEIFAPLAAGGAVILADDALALPSLPAASAVTLVNTVPSAMAELVRAGSVPRSVLVVNLAGEPLRRDLAERIFASGIGELHNLYGPSEDTTYSTGARVEPGDEREPAIGRPLPNTRVYVLDAALRLVPVGAPGELWLGGAGLARGYLRRPDLTADRFRPDPHGSSPGGRLYRTGDLARRRRDGVLDYLGRLDHQVKIRGFRIELGEIDASLLALPGVREAVVVARDQRLVAYVAGEATAAALRSALRERLPGHLVPAAFVVLPDLPRTPNGKVDRKALPDPERGSAPDDLAAPRTPLEELVAGVWAEVLGQERIGLHESFFDLGGHSLLATRVVSRLHAVLGVELPVRTLFERPTVAALAAVLEGASREPAPPIVPRPAGAAVPLSPAQERLWFLDRLAPGQPAYNLPVALRLRGPVSVPRLAAALAAVAGRHEALRTVFPESAGRPAPVVSPEPRFPLAVVDLTGLPGREIGPIGRIGPIGQIGPARQALALAVEEARLPFDLAAGPLCRAVLLRLDGEDHLLVIDVHHIVFDGGSTGVLLRELGLLAAGEALPPLTLQYADFAAWQRAWLAGGALAAQLEAWKERLAGAPSALDLPLDRLRPAAQTFRGGAEPVTLPEDLVHGLRSLGRSHGATLFMTVLAGWSALLQRMSGAPEVIVGSPVDNRRQPGLEGLIGLFVNTLPLRVDFGGDPPFAELLGRVRSTALAAYENQDVPFERLVDALEVGRDLSRSPLFQVLLALQEGEPPALCLPGVAAEEVPFHNGTAKFELLLALQGADDRLAGGLEFNADLFDRATARRLADRLARLLAAAAAGPEIRIGDLPLLDAAEERQILVDWNATEAPFPRDLGLHELFEAQARRTPEATALIHGTERVSYAALDARAGRLARHLRGLGAGPESLVGVFCGRTPGMIAAMLAVLESGSAYLPLDPAYPPERLRFLLEDSGAAIVLAETAVAAKLPDFGGTLVLVDGDPEDGGDEGPRGFLHPDQMAYAIYTSGSTGAPKGVMIRHGSAVARVAWALSAYPREVLAGVLAATSICFDLSVFEIFVPLAAGGTVILADDALAFPSLPAASAVTLVNTVPSAMTELVRSGVLPGSVRVVNLAGEPLRRDLAAKIYAQEGIEEVWNLYGPSEDTTYSTGARAERDGEREPAIGRPLPNTRAYVLDARLRPAPPGVPGELWLGGGGIARGYLRRPDLTADRFRPDPFGPAGRLYRTGDLVRQREDGTLDYLGRIDRQVKIRGFRIEPGEIENALLALPGMREAAVVATGDQQLVAYVAGDTSVAALRLALRDRLPAHMVPTAFVMLPALPLTPNGKLDRKALPAPDAPAEDDDAAPRTPVEELLAGIWAELLGRERVGIRQSFFEIGGHSLLATRVVTRLRDVLGVELPLRVLFERPTVAELAAAVEEARRRGASRRAAPPLVPIPREGPLPLSFAQERLWFIDQLSPGSALYNIPVALRLTGPLDARVLARALETVTHRHEALRTVFTAEDGVPAQLILPAAPLHLPLVDLAGLPGRSDPSHPSDLPARQARQPFDLRTGPLLRAVLLRLAAEEHVLLLTLHHIASDGWSMGLLLHEVLALYAAFAEGQPSPLPDLPVQYADFAVWQRSWLRGEVLAREIAWWRRQLSGLPPLLELPTDRPRPAVPGFRGTSRPVELPAGLTRQMEALGRREGATLFMVLLAGFQALLSRYSGQQDLAVGTPVAGRNQEEVAGLIGFFVNTLVLRADLGKDPSFRELLQQIRETALAAYAHQDVPFEKLVQELVPERNLAHTPLFQVMLSLQNTPLRPFALPGLSASPLPVDTGTAKFDLLLVLQESGGTLAGSLESNAGLFDASTVGRFLDHLLRLSAAAAASPDLRLSEIPLLSPQEQQELFAERRGLETAIPRTTGLHHLFEAQADRSPDATAVVFGEESLTYRDLDRAANRLAHLLIDRGVGPEIPVGLCLERSLEMVVGILGVLKAGGAYVPLDPALPDERLLFQLQDAGVAALVTRAAGRALPGWDGPLLHVEASSEGTAARPAMDGGGDHLAYILYTSGSTGRPKGVGVTHWNVVRLLEAAREPFGFGPKDAWTLFHSYAFDFSVWELWGALAHGGRVVVVPADVARSPEDFFRLLCAERVTVLNQTPSAFRQLAPVWDEMAERGAAPPVRWIVFGGEALELPATAAWLGRRGALPRLVNMYGITETTVHVTLRPVRAEDAAGPARSLIGGPLADLELYVAGRGLILQPLGVPGELCVGGEGLARGYWRRPELTAERFVPDPWSGRPGARLYRSGDLGRRLPDGDLEYLGRIDHQVKIRGLRIELGEIEATLGRHPAVRASVVLAVDRPGHPGTPGDRRLAAWVAVDPAVPTGVAELRAFLGERLAEYMVPASFVLMDALPLTPNGKVDRAALPAPEGVRPELEVSFVAPRTAEERAVAAAWQEVLGVERVGVYDNFFDLGGHSLLMVQVQARLRQAFAREVPVLDLFQHPTVGALARHLGAGKEEAAGPASLVASETRGESRRARAADQQLQRRRRRTGRTGDFET